MYKVLMFGTGKSSVLAENVLDEKVEVMAYIDNDRNKWGKKKNDRQILSADYIKNFNYDYIIVGSQFNEEICTQLMAMGIEKKNIFQYYKFIDSNWNYYKVRIEDFISKCDFQPEVLNTGISYAWVGFRTDICCRKAYNFAFGSQDLFYDYHTIKYLLENYTERTSKVKYVIIGLCYYNFQYDMSLSAMRGKVVLYYDVLKESHHFKNIQEVYEEYRINKQIANKLLRKKADGSYDFKWEVPTLEDYEDKWEAGRRQAAIDCNKNYPGTVKENIDIFKTYLQFLKKRNIKPIAVIYPATKYYTESFSDKLEEEFHSIINEIRKQYDFQYIDYFRSDLFSDEDFGDVSHLNRKGAEKFTRILNEEIHWNCT